MKTRKGYTLRSLGKEFILVADGFEAVDFSRMISLNETAAFLWKEVEDKDFDAEMLTTLLTDNYDIDRETAQNDVTSMLKSWSEAGIVED